MSPPAADPDPATASYAVAGIDDLQRAMASGTATAAALLASFRARVETVDVGGPALRSVIEVAPDADAIARERDAERAAGKLRGPLHGIPVLVKDNVDTADAMLTTAGSLAL